MTTLMTKQQQQRRVLKKLKSKDQDNQHDNIESLIPLFRPAFGCTDSSDFLVRSFVVRLRAGIRVIKHAQSKHANPRSQVRILHLHPDGKSITWSHEDDDEETNTTTSGGSSSASKSFKKKKKNSNNKNSYRRRALDLTTCTEVRYALGPRSLLRKKGTRVLRECCHHHSDIEKSLSLHFPDRTLDLTAATTDQAKVLLNGFSALCYRLRSAILIMNGMEKEKIISKKNGNDDNDSSDDDNGSDDTKPLGSSESSSSSASSSSPFEEKVVQEPPAQEKKAVYLIPATETNNRSLSSFEEKVVQEPPAREKKAVYPIPTTATNRRSLSSFEEKAVQNPPAREKKVVSPIPTTAANRRSSSPEQIITSDKNAAKWV